MREAYIEREKLKMKNEKDSKSSPMLRYKVAYQRQLRGSGL